MARELRIAFVALVGVVLLFFALSAALPRSWQVESAIEVPVPPERVAPLIGDLGQWRQWSTIDATQRTDTKIAVEGTASTPGQSIVWRGNGGEAVLRLTRADAAGVDYEYLTRLSGDGEFVTRGSGTLQVTASNGGSTVRWRDAGRADGMFERWFAWFGAQQNAYREFQEASLTRLRAKLEGK